MADNALANFVRWPWKQFVLWLAAPAEAEADRLGIGDPSERNAFAHAYTAALIAHGYQGMPISGGRPADAADLVDFLGRAKENLPGVFGQQDDFRDYYRDLWNNGIGADIGNYARAHLYPSEEIGKLVKDAMDDGTIVSLLTDSRIPAQPAGGYLSWPIPSPPQYQGPNAASDRQGFGDRGSALTPARAQEASPPTPAFAPDAVYSPMGDFYGNFPGTPGAAQSGSLPWQAASVNPTQAAPPLQPDVPSDSVDDPPVRRLGRRTYSLSQGSPFDPGAPVATAPAPPEGPLSLNDAYQYRKRLDANQSQASGNATDAPAAPLAPSNDSNFSGGLLGRLTALMNIDPQNPERLAPPLQDDELRAFYRDDLLQPWTVQRWR